MQKLIEPNEAIANLKCSCSWIKESHIAEDPIQLSCLHWICKKCILPHIEFNKIKCNICQKVNSRSLEEQQNSTEFLSVLNQNIQGALNMIYEVFESKINNSKSIMKEIEESTEIKIRFIREEVEIRIESLKLELDKIEQKFINKLNEIEKNCKYSLSPNDEFLEYENQMSKEMEDLKSIIESKRDLNQENVYKYQNKVKDLNNYLDTIRTKSPKIEFMESKTTLNTDIVGDVKCYFDNEVDRRIIKGFKEKKFETFNTGNSYPCDVCILSNGNRLICNYTHANILIFDSNNTYLKTIRTINGNVFRIISATVDDNNAIYLSNYGNHSIIKTDSEFNQLAQFGNGAGKTNDHLYKPIGIFFHNDSVYVCDRNNYRIQKLTSNLKFLESFTLDYLPLSIKILNNIACVRPGEEDSIYFHDTNTFIILKKYNGHDGVIGVSNSCFYEYYSTNKTLYCYDNNANMIEEIETADFGFGKSSWGSIAINSSKLIICSYGHSNLVII